MIYDKFARGYDKALAPFENWFLDKWRVETLSYLPENSKILEIGAGTGSNFKHYPNCRHAVASEISIKMLKVAQLKTTTIDLLQTDAENLPFPDNSFDAAFATLVFCAIPNPKKAFAELQRVLTAKDKIILLEHVRPNGLAGYFFDVLNIFTVALFEDHFNRNTARIAEDSGLKIVELKQKAFGIVNLIICEVEK
ncbi:MAG: methyltransferase domain-containing protein [Acidobacteriota bacterium]|jgi:ubiquinone/menaquinone biosynthesis C-methylase UbiE|nr:methyltransferase domain-containing protein [Acidobacteriota bacterium]